MRESDTATVREHSSIGRNVSCCADVVYFQKYNIKWEREPQSHNESILV